MKKPRLAELEPGLRGSWIIMRRRRSRYGGLRLESWRGRSAMAVRLALFCHPGEDGARPAGQARHLQQREAHAAGRELRVVPAVELSARGDGAHLVVELGPGS